MLPLSNLVQEQYLPPKHELLRQFHHITHVYLLIEGSVELTAFTNVAHRRHIDPDTLAATVSAREEPFGMQPSLFSSRSYLMPKSLASMMSGVLLARQTGNTASLVPIGTHLPALASSTAAAATRPIASGASLSSSMRTCPRGQYSKVRSPHAHMCTHGHALMVQFCAHLCVCQHSALPIESHPRRAAPMQGLFVRLADWPDTQVKMKLGERFGPCVLGDDAIRSSDMNSFVSVSTLSHCRVLAIPLALFKASMEVLFLLFRAHL
jgi:hypothetical protein